MSKKEPVFPKPVRLRCTAPHPVRVTGHGLVWPDQDLEVAPDLAKQLLAEGRFEAAKNPTKKNTEAK